MPNTITLRSVLLLYWSISFLPSGAYMFPICRFSRSVLLRPGRKKLSYTVHVLKESFLG